MADYALRANPPYVPPGCFWVIGSGRRPWPDQAVSFFGALPGAVRAAT